MFFIWYNNNNNIKEWMNERYMDFCYEFRRCFLLNK